MICRSPALTGMKRMQMLSAALILGGQVRSNDRHALGWQERQARPVWMHQTSGMRAYSSTAALHTTSLLRPVGRSCARSACPCHAGRKRPAQTSRLVAAMHSRYACTTFFTTAPAGQPQGFVVPACLLGKYAAAHQLPGARSAAQEPQRALRRSQTRTGRCPAGV